VNENPKNNPRCRGLSVSTWHSLPPQQSQAAFEVADIKASDPSNPMPQKSRVLPGGRLEVPGMTLRNLITMAYGVQEDMISGGPKWADGKRFDIVAKAPSEASMPALRR
jgi:uncharacterized protein (TIGR03435 family)